MEHMARLLCPLNEGGLGGAGGAGHDVGLREDEVAHGGVLRHGTEGQYECKEEMWQGSQGGCGL